MYPWSLILPASKDPRRQYLKLRGAQWFLNYPIPADVRPEYLSDGGKPKTHIVQTTGTSDLNEAHRRKFGLIQKLEVEFSRARREAAGTLPADVQLAKRLAADLSAASNAEDYELAGTIQLLITEQAQKVDVAGGSNPRSEARARSFIGIATGGETLLESFETWMDHSTLPARTKAKYRTAVEEFTSFLGGLVLTSDVNVDNAHRYVDWLNKEARSQRTKKLIPLSYNTKRDRVMALSAFWSQWLRPRKKVKAESNNPWSKLIITEKPTPSGIKWDSMDNTGRPQRRDAFEESELLAILAAPGPTKGSSLRYPKRTLMELFSLALLTGSRPDELCSLLLGDIKVADGVYWLNFDETKTKDDRRIPVVHDIAVGILKRRMGDRKDPKAQLFDELRPKGKGGSLYELVGRALGRHLDRATGLSSSAVPYAARHTFATIVGNMDGIKDHALKRYIGHKPEGMTDERYRNTRPEDLLAVARKVRLPLNVEAKMRDNLAPSIEG
jgi:integrase